MKLIQEQFLRNASTQKLNNFLDGLFNETIHVVTESQQWPTRSKTHGVIVRQHSRDKKFQRSSEHSNVTYDQLRELLFVNHSLNETKYIKLMVEAIKLFDLPTDSNNDNNSKGKNDEGSFGVYWLGFKATSASSREFVELVATREQKNESNGLREFLVVSKPVIPTNLPPARNYVRGRYEAWERVRELENGKVEWICVQRSDPGGWIPRCLSNWVIAKEFHQDVHSVLDYISKGNNN